MAINQGLFVLAVVGGLAACSSQTNGPSQPVAPAASDQTASDAPATPQDSNAGDLSIGCMAKNFGGKIEAEEYRTQGQHWFLAGAQMNGPFSISPSQVDFVVLGGDGSKIAEITIDRDSALLTVHWGPRGVVVENGLCFQHQRRTDIIRHPVGAGWTGKYPWGTNSAPGP